jgi:hypothetical protein
LINFDSVLDFQFGFWERQLKRLKEKFRVGDGLPRFLRWGACAALFALGGAPAWGVPPPLVVSGSQIVTSSGCTVLLKGVDVDGLEFSSNGYSGSWPGSLLSVAQEAVTGWGCNVIRLPLDQDWWFGCSNSRGAPSSSAAYQSIVNSIVQFCSDNNAYIILDLHWSGTSSATTFTSPCSGAGWGTANGQQPMADANAITFWGSVASIYGNNPAVLFDLYNEPNGVLWPTWQGSGSMGSAGWTPGMQALLNAVRNQGGAGAVSNVCLAGGLNWCQDFSGLPSYPLSGTNICYSTHLYGNQVGDYASANGSYAGWSSMVANATARGPVFVGEFAPSTSCGTDVPTYDTNMFNWIGSPGVSGGTAWSMTNSSCPNLYTGTFVPNAFGAAVTGWLATPAPNCIYTNTPTPSPTPCNYPGFTCTPTDTPTPTNTPTATATFNPNNNIIFPNPWDGSVPLYIYHTLTTPADKVNIKVFTIGFRKVAEIDGYPSAAGQPTYYIYWNQMGNVANGLYYVVVEENRGRKQTQTVLKLLVRR